MQTKVLFRRYAMYTVNMKVRKLHKIKIWGQEYPFEILYKYTKTPILTTEEEKVKVVLPMKYKKVDMTAIMEVLQQKLYEAIAEKEIENIMEKIRIQLKFAPDDYEIRRMRNSLGKCVGNTIVINPDIVKYRRNVIEYVILHEFCHLKYKNHTKKFYALLQEYMPNYERVSYEVVGLEY